jgi:pimeloyl-ACP methyl ester carboxylesterase
MRDVVREALAGISGPIVVVGHSLGSVLAYDVLREDAASLDVPLLVTIGSPLAVVEIEDLVVRPLRVPAPVRAWRNVADGADFVALDPTIRGEYPPAQRCTDYLVKNPSETHHGATEYLATRPVRDPVRALCGLPSA